VVEADQGLFTQILIHVIVGVSFILVQFLSLVSCIYVDVSAERRQDNVQLS